MFNVERYINHNTKIKTNYCLEKKSYYLNKLFKYKTYASHKIVKYMSKLAIKLKEAQTTNRAMWVSFLGPIFRVIHKVWMYFIQGLLYITIIPLIRLKIILIERDSKK